MTPELKAPFPYFGGKHRVADIIWEAFGAVDNYVEPFFGSGAVLLGRPTVDGKKYTETVNDADGFICNFWRALQSDPEAVAKYADWPVNESDLEARHLWLVGRRADLTTALNDPDYYDAKIAGWWVWGISCWIGSGWCSGNGPWILRDGKIVDTRQLPHLGNAGRGVNRQRPHLGNAGQGVNRKLPHLGDAGRGVNRGDGDLENYLAALAERLKNVRVCCGDWSRVCGPSVTFKHGMTGIFLDPPYTDKADRAEVYAVDCDRVGHDVARWCRENGDNPLLRIALCGYEGEYDLPGWRKHSWKAAGGYENQSTGDDGPSGNCLKERIWFSPGCINNEMDLFR